MEEIKLVFTIVFVILISFLSYFINKTSSDIEQQAPFRDRK